MIHNNPLEAILLKLYFAEQLKVRVVSFINVGSATVKKERIPQPLVSILYQSIAYSLFALHILNLLTNIPNAFRRRKRYSEVCLNFLLVTVSTSTK
jgi:hypothetical protein